MSSINASETGPASSETGTASSPVRDDHGSIASARPRVAVVIPAYRVSGQIVDLIARIGDECRLIYVVDDKCPDQSGDLVERHVNDARVQVLTHAENQGVGGAMITGFRRAIADGADIVVKIDGDGQMDPRLISQFVKPIVGGRADYAKGNRFFNIEDVKAMPRTRLLGNVVLSFMTKLSSGYWSLFDPNNGYVAIDARVLATLPLDKVSKRYFFESDMLFRLNIARARVVDVPMQAIYADETSSLKPLHMVPTFLRRHCANAFKRIFYSYFLRDFSLASIELLVGISMLLFGIVFGVATWISNSEAGVVSTTGTVMLSVLPLLLGVQLLLAFIGYDVANVPQEPIGPLLPPQSRGGRREGASADGSPEHLTQLDGTQPLDPLPLDRDRRHIL